MHIKSLRKQLLLWLLIPLLIVLTVSTLVSYSRALYFANLAYDRSLFRAALALANQIDVMDQQVLINLPQVARELLDYDKDDVIYYRVSAPDGSLVVGEATLAPPKTLPKPNEPLYYDSEFNQQPVRVAAIALAIVNAPLQGNILVQVAETRTKREAMVTEIVEEMIVPQLLTLILAATLIFFAIRRGLLPLQRLQAAINQRSHLDLSELDTQDAPEEIQPLLNAMNNLMQRVRDAVRLQQRFIADASHQLRTPIAGLQTQAELALRDKNPEQTQDTIKLILTSASKLSHLLNRLLSMASVDPAAEREVKHQPTNLLTMATDVTSDFVTLARQKDLDLGLEIETASAQILGDELMLREMLANLIDNAITYTPAHGMITVCIKKSNNIINLSVIDNGIGIPLDERTRVFERFHRVHDNEGQGCGLGLAIVSEVVRSHHGHIEILDGFLHDNQVTYGTHMQVTFPALWIINVY